MWKNSITPRNKARRISLHRFSRNVDIRHHVEIFYTKFHPNLLRNVEKRVRNLLPEVKHNCHWQAGTQLPLAQQLLYNSYTYCQLILGHRLTWCLLRTCCTGAFVSFTEIYSAQSCLVLSKCSTRNGLREETRL